MNHARFQMLRAGAFACLGLVSWSAGGVAHGETAPYRKDRILVMPRSGATAALAELHAHHRASVIQEFPGLSRLQVVRVPEGRPPQQWIGIYQKSGLVQYAEPDYFRFLDLAPNDPRYLDGSTWHLNNYGQSGGAADADIDAPEAWDILPYASNVVVAILDTGIRYTHEDLTANMWVNASDGSHGFNSITGTTNVMDDNGHGTLLAGVLGAVGNNGKGLAGVVWRTQIMAVKCFDSGGNSSDSQILGAIEFARTNGAQIMVAAFDSPGYSASLSNAIYAAREAGVVFVASVGNNATDIDPVPRYPACYGIDNIVAVTATTRSDALLGIANYGATNVDLAAPGESLYTTWSPSDAFYTSLFSGTSYAAPGVAGAFALLKERFPAQTHQQLIARLLQGVDPLPALAGKCVTGGRLNLRKALSPPIRLTLTTIVHLPGEAYPQLQWRISAGPQRDFVVEASNDLSEWSPIINGTTSELEGTADFVDMPTSSLARRFYRVVATP